MVTAADSLPIPYASAAKRLADGSAFGPSAPPPQDLSALKRHCRAVLRRRLLGSAQGHALRLPS